MELRRSFRKNIAAPAECLGIDVEAEKKKNDDFEVLTYPGWTLRNLYTFIVFPTLVYAFVIHVRNVFVRVGFWDVLLKWSPSVLLWFPWLNNGYFPLYATQNSMSSMLYTSPNVWWNLRFRTCMVDWILRILPSVSQHSIWDHVLWDRLFYKIGGTQDPWITFGVTGIFRFITLKRHIYVPLRKRGWLCFCDTFDLFHQWWGHEIVLSVPFDVKLGQCLEWWVRLHSVHSRVFPLSFNSVRKRCFGSHRVGTAHTVLFCLH